MKWYSFDGETEADLDIASSGDWRATFTYNSTSLMDYTIVKLFWKNEEILSQSLKGKIPKEFLPRVATGLAITHAFGRIADLQLEMCYLQKEEASEDT